MISQTDPGYCWKYEKNIQVEYPSGCGPLPTVFSTEMDKAASQLSPASGFLGKASLEVEKFDF